MFLLAAMTLSSTLFAQGGPPKLQASAAIQMQALRGIKTSRTTMQNKIDSRLFLGLLHQRNDARLAPLTDFRFMKPETDGRVPVDVIVTSSGGVKTVVNKLESLGGVVKAKSFRYQRISARMRLQDLETLAALPDVRRIRQAIPALRHAVRNFSEGDKTHGADEARGFFGATGSGVKVCVLSDGVDSLATLQASGDLPPMVDVLPGQAGSGDEGSAMLEIVHDLAPGAALGFATADTDEPTFASNILDLAAAGCNVIVDDVIYLDESPFEDSAIAQSVNTVTAAGVLYFSSAGNEGNVDDGTSGTWEGDFLASAAADPAPLAGANLHDFGDGGNSISVTSSFFEPAILIWAEHYDLATSNASTDFDLYDMDDGLTTIFDASTDVQDGTPGSFPIEFLGNGTLDGDRLLIDKFAAGTTSSVPMFNLINFRAVLDDTLSTTGATRGHSAAAAAFSVAATPAAASFDGISADGPYPGLFTSANESEDFTSDGPRRIILDGLTGAELTPGNRTSTGGVVRQKPEITAADGVSTNSSAPGGVFNPFYGTSAAAPHAAAIAALCKSAVPSITPAQLRTALTSTAIDIETPGVDRDTGAGIIMAHAFLLACGATPQAVLAAGTPVKTEVGGDHDAFVEIGEDWSLTVPLTNVGGVNATAISAVLTSSTPGVVILSGTSTYPDMAPGAVHVPVTAFVNNTQPYIFTTKAPAACGGVLQFTLTVTYTGGNQSPQSFDFSIQTGAPGAPATFSYTGPAVPIPDSAGADVAGVTAIATLPVVSSGNLYSLKASIDGATCNATAGSTTVGIDHSFVNDLQIDLKSPGGTLVTIINRADGGGNNYCQVVLDDTAATSIQSITAASAPFTGTYTPAAPLSGFGGQAINGTWELHATDFFVGDTGNIRAWSLVATPAVCDAAAVSPVLSAVKSVSGGQHNPGDPVTYTIVITNTGTGFQPDASGDEFTDTLPTQLTLVGTPGANSGTITVTGTNPATVHWNGSLAPGASVTITIQATINTGTAGQTVSNSGTVNYDANRDLANDASAPTQPPTGTGPTTFVAGGVPPAPIPTLSDFGLALLALTLSALAVITLRKRRQKSAS
jgi:fimbrial isopeptide formation D2 family protein